MKIKPCVLITAIAIIMPFSGVADVRPTGLFADGMVIQRETKAPVWGWADAGERVTVTASWGETATTVAGENGQWMVKLQTPSAGGPHTLTINGNNAVEIKNVLSGEVWFCSGQSNMDFALNMLAKTSPRTEKKYEPAVAYVKQEMETAQDELFRQFEVEKNTSPFEPLDALKGSWKASSPANNPEFSATAYFFGRELRKELGVPVGLIKCAWGGTRVEPWIPAEAYREDAEMAAYFERESTGLKDQISKWDPAKVEANYQAALKKWETTKQGRKPRLAEHPKENKQIPSTLFNAMVHPVIPYAMKGAIWYQGESNAGHNTEKYEHNFRTMISAWREQWGQGDFPFYFAQLANFKVPVTEPVEYDGWALVCDQQRRTLGLKNTGMAVLNDIGEANDIHPHNKMDVGKRLALWALAHDYNKAVPACSGPLYKSHEIKGGKVVIKFDHADSGLMTGIKNGMADAQKTDEPLKHFQICGADRQWKWAQAEITGKDTIDVSHPEVAEPAVVRYAWAQNPEVANLYNKEGLPASIFTTEAEIPAKAAGVAPSKAKPVSSKVKSLSGVSLKKDDRIVFLGDSITAMGAKPEGYVTLTSQSIAKAFPDLGIEVIGAGRGGHKVPDCQNRLDRDVLQKNPTIVVIYIGINDVWHWTHPKVVARGKKGTTPEQFESGLKDMIGKINDIGARVILCTPSVIGEKPDGSNPQDKMLDEYADISRKVARVTGSQLLDLRTAFIDYLKDHNPENAEQGILTEDGVHMNADGNRFLSTLVRGALKVPAAEGARRQQVSARGKSRLVAKLEAGEQQTVVVYGTSLTKVGAWSDQFRTVLDQNYPGQATLINSAQGGSNSDWGRKSFDEKVIKKNPDAVFIEFAINDSVAGRNVSVEQARENLEEMMDRLLKSNPDCEIILMTMNPCVAHHKARRPDLSAYYQMYRDVAGERELLLIDHYPVWEKLLNEEPGLFLSYVPDGIHPVREGALQVIMPTMIQSLGLKQGKPELNERTACWDYLFGMMDKEVKRDKQVARAEYDQYWKKHFAKTDADKDGALTSGEYKPAVLFRHIDADNDGTITLKEYLAVYAPHFGRFDINPDDKLVMVKSGK